MGRKADEVLEIGLDEFEDYLRVHHSVYMEYGDKLYYLTDANTHYWRAQDTSVLNEKNHYVDCSDLVPYVGEFLVVPFADGKTIPEAFEDATFYASVKKEEE